MNRSNPTVKNDSKAWFSYVADDWRVMVSNENSRRKYS